MFPRKIDRNLAYTHLIEMGVEPWRASMICFMWSDFRLFLANVGY